MQVLRETYTEKCARRRWGFVLWVLALVVLGAWASSIGGCATIKPPCPIVTLDVVKTAIGDVYVLDAENLALLVQRMKGLTDQSCDPNRDGKAGVPL